MTAFDAISSLAQIMSEQGWVWCQKEGAGFAEGAAGELPGSTNWRVLGPVGEGNREGAHCHHTLDDLVQGQGVGGFRNYLQCSVRFGNV